MSLAQCNFSARRQAGYRCFFSRAGFLGGWRPAVRRASLARPSPVPPSDSAARGQDPPWAPGSSHVVARCPLRRPVEPSGRRPVTNRKKCCGKPAHPPLPALPSVCPSERRFSTSLVLPHETPSIRFLSSHLPLPRFAPRPHAPRRFPFFTTAVTACDPAASRVAKHLALCSSRAPTCRCGSTNRPAFLSASQSTDILRGSTTWTSRGRGSLQTHSRLSQLCIQPVLQLEIKTLFTQVYRLGPSPDFALYLLIVVMGSWTCTSITPQPSPCAN